ncbi:helix-turn-helix transcriptional regulator [Pandoraea pneumonica]|uniref:helix-turn-helix transcriptional regulator n=1 Tax=Pandoraea pneumonica TaxID=2508299 RepID=UPI003CEE6C0D
MAIQGELRARLRQLHQLPVSTLDYLPVWLETMRTLLAADAVAALWHDSQSGFSTGGHWLAPQASVAACERFAASDATMPLASDGWERMSRGELIRGHARRVRRGNATPPPGHTLTRSAELDACLGGGDVLDIRLMPVLRRRPDAGEATPRSGPLRLFVSRAPSRPRFSARDMQVFEQAAAEFAFPSTRPRLPPPGLWSRIIEPSAHCLKDNLTTDICHDVSGTLIWHDERPEWADPAALSLMQRVWRGASGEVWPDACLVVQECGALAAELTSQPDDASSPGRHASRRMAMPGGTLHLHATRLRNMSARPTERVRIALHLAVPSALRLMTRLWATPLTPMQREIAMRLLAGESRAQAREACGIGVQTLKTHLSSMRARLDPVRDAALLRGLGGLAGQRTGSETP